MPKLKMNIFVKSKRKIDIASKLKAKYKKEVQNTYRSIGQKGVNNIRSEIKKRDLILTGDMYRSVRYKMTPNGVKYLVDEPASYLEKGIRKHQMKYLMKSKKPIPVDVANGIFRWASPKSMAEGKWVNPGVKRGKRFFETAVKRTREQTAEQFKSIAKKVF
jgi:hypothetical protein